MEYIGCEIVDIRVGRVVLRLPNRPQVTQQHGYIHGGAISSIADVSGGYAALSTAAEDADVLTVEFKINLIAPGRGDYVEAVGTVVKAGRTLTFCNLEVFASDAGVRKLVATGQQTMMTFQAKS